jgi:hypothetical protein
MHEQGPVLSTNKGVFGGIQGGVFRQLVNRFQRVQEGVGGSPGPFFQKDADGTKTQ